MTKKSSPDSDKIKSTLKRITECKHEGNPCSKCGMEALEHKVRTSVISISFKKYTARDYILELLSVNNLSLVQFPDSVMQTKYQFYRGINGWINVSVVVPAGEESYWLNKFRIIPMVVQSSIR